MTGYFPYTARFPFCYTFVYVCYLHYLHIWLRFAHFCWLRFTLVVCYIYFAFSYTYVPPLRFTTGCRLPFPDFAFYGSGLRSTFVPHHHGSTFTLVHATFTPHTTTFTVLPRFAFPVLRFALHLRSFTFFCTPHHHVTLPVLPRFAAHTVTTGSHHAFLHLPAGFTFFCVYDFYILPHCCCILHLLRSFCYLPPHTCVLPPHFTVLVHHTGSSTFCVHTILRYILHVLLHLLVSGCTVLVLLPFCSSFTTFFCVLHSSFSSFWFFLRSFFSVLLSFASSSLPHGSRFVLYRSFCPFTNIAVTLPVYPFLYTYHTCHFTFSSYIIRVGSLYLRSFCLFTLFPHVYVCYCYRSTFTFVRWVGSFVLRSSILRSFTVRSTLPYSSTLRCILYVCPHGWLPPPTLHHRFAFILHLLPFAFTFYTLCCAGLHIYFTFYTLRLRLRFATLHLRSGSFCCVLRFAAACYHHHHHHHTFYHVRGSTRWFTTTHIHTLHLRSCLLHLPPLRCLPVTLRSFVPRYRLRFVPHTHTTLHFTCCSCTVPRFHHLLHIYILITFTPHVTFVHAPFTTLRSRGYAPFATFAFTTTVGSHVHTVAYIGYILRSRLRLRYVALPQHYTRSFTRCCCCHILRSLQHCCCYSPFVLRSFGLPHHHVVYVYWLTTFYFTRFYIYGLRSFTWCVLFPFVYGWFLLRSLRYVYTRLRFAFTVRSLRFGLHLPRTLLHLRRCLCTTTVPLPFTTLHYLPFWLRIFCLRCLYTLRFAHTHFYVYRTFYVCMRFPHRYVCYVTFYRFTFVPFYVYVRLPLVHYVRYGSFYVVCLCCLHCGCCRLRSSLPFTFTLVGCSRLFTLRFWFTFTHVYHHVTAVYRIFYHVLHFTFLLPLPRSLHLLPTLVGSQFYVYRLRFYFTLHFTYVSFCLYIVHFTPYHHYTHTFYNVLFCSGSFAYTFTHGSVCFLCHARSCVLVLPLRVYGLPPFLRSFDCHFLRFTGLVPPPPRSGSTLHARSVPMHLFTYNILPFFYVG